MATAQGVRFALARIPLPGTGFDDQFRFSMAGIPFPADAAIPAPVGETYESRQRGKLAWITMPGGFDAQTRFHIAGMVRPTDRNTNMTVQQRAFLGNIRAWPGGGFDANDRAHIAGIYPYKASILYQEIIDLSFTWTPRFVESGIPGASNVNLQGVLNSVASDISLQATGGEPETEGVVASIDLSVAHRDVLLETSAPAIALELTAPQILLTMSTRSISLSVSARDADLIVSTKEIT